MSVPTAYGPISFFYVFAPAPHLQLIAIWWGVLQNSRSENGDPSKGHRLALPPENVCTALGSLPTGYAGLDTGCTKVSACAAGDGSKACAAGYNGAVSSRKCTTNGAAFDAFTGCTGVGVVADSHGALHRNGTWDAGVC